VQPAVLIDMTVADVYSTPRDTASSTNRLYDILGGSLNWWVV